MKKNILSICILAVVAALLSSCGPTVSLGTPHQEIDPPYNHNAEVCAAAKEAVKSMMTDTRVLSFLEKYEEERKTNPELSERPIVKLAKIGVDPDDSELNTDQITDALSDAIGETGRLEVSLYEGEGRRRVSSRPDLLADDPFYEQQQETIQAARLVLHSKVIMNEVRDGRTNGVSGTIKISLIDVNSGVTLSEHTQQITMMKKAIFTGR